jgi:uncharacterized protein (TIRG00374 family)
VKNTTLNSVLRPLFGVLLILFLLRQLDTAKLYTVFSKLSWSWFALACVSLIVSNLFSVARWQKITTKMGLIIQFKHALYLYAQGITANTVLPGGIVGGDVWRTLGLVKIAQQQSKHSQFSHAEAAASVLLDRVGGLWSLCIFSLVALVLVCISTSSYYNADVLMVIEAYAALLVAATISPLAFMNAWLSAKNLQTLASGLSNKWVRKLVQTIAVISANIHQLIVTLSQSLLVQVFAVFTLYCCLRAVGVEISYLEVAALSLAIFLSAIIPASISGFGARELAAVAVLGLVGVNPESAFSASFLFGLAGTLQGLLGIYFWLKKAPDLGGK